MIFILCILGFYHVTEKADIGAVFFTKKRGVFVKKIKNPQLSKILNINEISQNIRMSIVRISNNLNDYQLSVKRDLNRIFITTITTIKNKQENI